MMMNKLLRQPTAWLRRLALLPVYAALIAVSLLFIFPFYWVSVSSLESIKGLDLKPPALFPAVERSMNASIAAKGRVFEVEGESWLMLCPSPDLAATGPGSTGPGSTGSASGGTSEASPKSTDSAEGFYCLQLHQAGPKAPLTPSMLVKWFSADAWSKNAKAAASASATIRFTDLKVSQVNQEPQGIISKQVIGSGADLHEVLFTVPAGPETVGANSKTPQGAEAITQVTPVLDPQVNRLLVFHAQIENYAQTLKGPEASIGGESAGFLLFMRNSLFLAIFAVFGQVLSSSLVAYAFARLRFKGRDTLFIILLATMMIPGQVTMIPLFFVYRSLHWVNTFLPLMVPTLTAGAFNVFLIRQFLLGFPKELDESAVIDGASHWQIYRRIILPNCGPVLTVVGLFTFVASWQDVFGPLIYLDSPSLRTVTLGLEYFRSPYVDNRPLLMAGAVLSIIPVFILFLFAQKHILAGIATTGLKN